MNDQLFYIDGHLTDFALAALMDGRLDQLHRLEVGEHLSYCDHCLDRYSELLTLDTLKVPETDPTPVIMQRIRRNKWRASIRRYTAAVAAVAIGSSLWYSGLLTAMGDAMLHPPIPEPAKHGISAPFDAISDLGSSFQSAVEEWSVKVQDAAASAFHSPNGRSHQPQTNQMEDLQ